MNKGQTGAIPMVFAIVMGTVVLANLTLPQIKDPFRARKAVDLCYCMETGGTEYACKAKTDIKTEKDFTLAKCQSWVDVQTKDFILDYIKDNIMVVKHKNLGNL